ncbi:uncharacterized protein M421DRAFT_64059 [Didymella exigua CBS 183.55]|uniref:Uncharacterized protein n=1 Tax=Didymella exigua CBS 183.55 TaxID=1150837 RepID=A0A6A5RNL2_9PLEO|nr:uncharacterized protein M421DRAFT_64059 [Didymella exigua CBS 183.55]KAF1927926.1 hypothetical protein M421DRAFT_64059 [Didymella exigua CBS 183.55]
MSWNGPVAGAAPYQAPPYANGQPSYGQHPPYQYGQQSSYGQYQTGPSYPGPQQRTQDNRPPKKKGNPIITRYPPPPGYRGPAQPQGSFNTHQHPAQYHQPTQPGFPQVPPVQPTYPSQGYIGAAPQQGFTPQSFSAAKSSYPSSYPQGQNYQWSQQAYQASQGPPQAPVYPNGQNYGAPQTSYQQRPALTAATGPSQQGYSQAPGWPAAHAQAQTTYPLQSQYNSYSGPAINDHPMLDPNATPTQATAQPVSAPTVLSHSSASTSHDSATSKKQELYLAWDDWDFDFDGAIWPKSNEPVDPNLSLGVIIWHPAKQMTRALPATFEEAEEQSLKPVPEKFGNGESVSIYFTAENSHEAFLNVRQTDEWDYIKDDPAFVIFTDEEMQQNLMPVEDCIAQRDRPDEFVDEAARHEDAEMREADWNIMDNLEQALSGGGDKAEARPAGHVSVAEPAMPQTQEDILAALGVTGQPKPVSEEPMTIPVPTQDVKAIPSLPEKPRISPPPPAMSRPPAESQRSQSLGGPRAINPPAGPQRPYGSMSSNIGRPPPPPPERDRYDPWNPCSRHQQYHPNGFNGGRGSPARSEASDGTAAGSDFGPEKPAEASELAATPGAKFERSDSSVSRKRSYGDTDADDERLRQHDDHTKRKRRSQVDAAYG